MDQIKIENLEVFCNHGLLKEENVLGQKFLVSLQLYTDTREAGLEDKMHKSIHYGEVCHFITRYMKEHTFQLIEAVAEHLAEELLLQYENLQEVTIEVKKPWAPIGLPLENVSVQIARSWHTAYLALGSNLGNKEQYLQEAVDSLNSHKRCKVIKMSDFILTKPYGPVEQEDFLNGCLELKTLLSPFELLELIGQLEQSANRVREIHWGPRTLDLDLIFYDHIILEDERLIIPHPEMHKRSFVLTPLSQIAPYFVHPLMNKRVVELKDSLK